MEKWMTTSRMGGAWLFDPFSNSPFRGLPVGGELLELGGSTIKKWQAF